MGGKQTHMMAEYPHTFVCTVKITAVVVAVVQK